MSVIEMPIKVIPLERRRDENAAGQQNTSRRPESQARECLTYATESARRSLPKENLLKEDVKLTLT